MPDETEPVGGGVSLHRPIEDVFVALADWLMSAEVAGGHVGRVTTSEPPSRLLATWEPGPTEIEVTLETVDGGLTRVNLQHRGWDSFEGGAQARAAYDHRWPGELARFGRDLADPACHRAFAVAANNLTWSLLAGNAPAPADIDDLLHTVHAAAWHWAVVGEPVNRARSEWLVSHVYAVLGWGPAANHHAALSLAICEEHGIGDFDLAYAYEGVARAAAAAGDTEQSAAYRTKALAAADAIGDPEDREWFVKDFEAGPWYGPR